MYKYDNNSMGNAKEGLYYSISPHYLDLPGEIHFG